MKDNVTVYLYDVVWWMHHCNLSLCFATDSRASGAAILFLCFCSHAECLWESERLSHEGWLDTKIAQPCLSSRLAIFVAAYLWLSCISHSLGRSKHSLPFPSNKFRLDTVFLLSTHLSCFICRKLGNTLIRFLAENLRFIPLSCLYVKYKATSNPLA